MGRLFLLPAHPACKGNMTESIVGDVFVAAYRAAVRADATFIDVISIGDIAAFGEMVERGQLARKSLPLVFDEVIRGRKPRKESNATRNDPRQL